MEQKKKNLRKRFKLDEKTEKTIVIKASDIKERMERIKKQRENRK